MLDVVTISFIILHIHLNLCSKFFSCNWSSAVEWFFHEFFLLILRILFCIHLVLERMSPNHPKFCATVKYIHNCKNSLGIRLLLPVRLPPLPFEGRVCCHCNCAQNSFPVDAVDSVVFRLVGWKSRLPTNLQRGFNTCWRRRL